MQLLRMGTDRPGRWLCVTGLNRAIDGQKSVWSFVHQRSFAVVVSVGSERGRPRSLRRPDGGQRSFRGGFAYRLPVAARKVIQVIIVTSSRVHQTRGLHARGDRLMHYRRRPLRPAAVGEMVRPWALRRPTLSCDWVQTDRTRLRGRHLFELCYASVDCGQSKRG